MAKKPEMDEGYKLKRPCKHCPFAPTDTRIVFACAERAEEIAEAAYRNGFPCHRSAQVIEDDENGEGGGFVFGEGSQHCAGAIMMFLADGYAEWPGINNDEDLADRLSQHVDWNAPHYKSEEDFIAANTGAIPRRAKEEVTMPKTIGPKEAALRAQREAAAGKQKAVKKSAKPVKNVTRKGGRGR